MFGNIGIGELMLILLVALLVFGPDKLPETARNLGKFIRNFQRETQSALNELKSGLGPIKDSFEPLKAGIFDEPDAAAAIDPDVGASSATPNGSARKAVTTATRPKASARTSAARSKPKRATPKRATPKRSASSRTSPARNGARRARSSASASKTPRRKK